jgi:hypothetical protein
MVGTARRRAFAHPTDRRIHRLQLSNSDRCTSAFSRRDAPELCVNSHPLKTRGRRESRVRAAPAVSCAIGAQKCAHEHTRPAESIRLSLRSGFTAYFVLSPVSRALLPPSPAEIGFCKLGASFGRQDHTALPYAQVCVRLPQTLASTASHRAFVTTRDPPLSSGETGGNMD